MLTVCARDRWAEEGRWRGHIHAFGRGIGHDRRCYEEAVEEARGDLFDSLQVLGEN